MMKIRRFRLKDLNEIIKIAEKCLGKSYAKKRRFIRYYKFDPKYFLVAVVDDKLVGFACCSSFSIIQLDLIAVLPAYRKLGVGSGLTRKIIEQLKTEKVKHFMLMCDAEDKKLIGFYRKLGFKRLACILKYYKDGGHGALMLKTIS